MTELSTPGMALGSRHLPNDCGTKEQRTFPANLGLQKGQMSMHFDIAQQSFCFLAARPVHGTAAKCPGHWHLFIGEEFCTSTNAHNILPCCHTSWQWETSYSWRFQSENHLWVGKWSVAVANEQDVGVEPSQEHSARMKNHSEKWKRKNRNHLLLTTLLATAATYLISYPHVVDEYYPARSFLPAVDLNSMPSLIRIPSVCEIQLCWLVVSFHWSHFVELLYMLVSCYPSCPHSIPVIFRIFIYWYMDGSRVPVVHLQTRTE